MCQPVMYCPTCLWAPFAALLLLAHASPAIPLTQLSSVGSPRGHQGVVVPIYLKRGIVTNVTPTHALTLHTYVSLLPLSTAASTLFELYTTLFSNASGPWRARPAYTSFTAHCGNIYIDFQTSDAYFIPWSFVAEFAGYMIRATEKGFTGGFEGEYKHRATGAVISVGLRIVMAAAAA